MKLPSPTDYNNHIEYKVAISEYLEYLLKEYNILKENKNKGDIQLESLSD